MTDEETALVVDKQLVEFSRHRSGNAQAFGGPRHDGSECLGPMFASDRKAARLDLPSAADLCIDDGL